MRAGVGLMGRIVTLLIALTMSVLAGPATSLAQSGNSAASTDPTPEERSALNRTWTGNWIGGGFVFKAQLVLKVSRDDQAEGHIVWTVISAPRHRTKYRKKIGRKGTEHIRGHYDPATNLLSIKGVRKDDPNNVIGLDAYRLVLAPNHAMLVGVSSHKGQWDASIVLRR
jgi:hypothetical protein